MKLEFIVDENYLVVHTLLSTTPPMQHIEDVMLLKQRIKDMNYGKRGYFSGLDESFLAILPLFLVGKWKDDKQPFSVRARDLVSRLSGTDEYERILHLTKQYQKQIEEEWLSNYNRTLGIMQEMTGLDFKEDEFRVYLTLLNNGLYLGDRIIVYGQIRPDYPNSRLIALWHEIMHDKLPSSPNKTEYASKIDHALIQLATDNELRVQLNGGQYPPFVGGHTYLFPTMQRMLPDWVEYLTSSRRNIIEFDNKMLQKYTPSWAKLVMQ